MNIFSLYKGDIYTCFLYFLSALQFLDDRSNTELSQYDIIKIQKSYGCEACGGPQWGSGGDIKAAGSVTEAACLWWLTTDSNKQIVIDISVSCNLIILSHYILILNLGH